MVVIDLITPESHNFDSLSPRRCGSNLKVQFLNICYEFSSEGLLVE